ncbi:hypothetical protein ACFL4W_02240 [Planctomycetota bacterium]
MKEFFNQPFFYGLAIGLIIAIVEWFAHWNGRRSLRKEVKELKNHLHTQMSINTKGNDNVTSEVDTLKKQNENLRITVASLKNKPNRAELRTLHLYDRAIHLMYEKSPGFATAWEIVLKDAEAEIEKADTGVVAWMRKIVRPSIGKSSGTASDSSAAKDMVQIDPPEEDE